MFKVYKRTLHIGRNDASRKLESSLYEDKVINQSELSFWSKMPAIITATLVGVFALSVIFAAILLPLGILGLTAWWRYRKLRKNQSDQTIDAEYTVITEAESKSVDERF